MQVRCRPSNAPEWDARAPRGRCAAVHALPVEAVVGRRRRVRCVGAGVGGGGRREGGGGEGGGEGRVEGGGREGGGGEGGGGGGEGRVAGGEGGWRGAKGGWRGGRGVEGGEGGVEGGEGGVDVVGGKGVEGRGDWDEESPSTRAGRSLCDVRALAASADS